MTEKKVNNFKVFIHLIKIYLGASFSNIGKNKKASKKSKSKVLGVFGVGLVILLLALYFGFLLGMMNYTYYNTLEQIGLQNLLFYINALLVTLGVLVFSIATIFATYHAGTIEDMILSLPIGSNVRLLAKMFSTYLMLAVVSIVDFVVLAAIFTIKQGMMPIPFYVYSVVAGIFLPVLPILLGYCIAILLMRYTRFLKSKTLIMVLGLIFAVGINIFIQINARQNTDMLDSIMKMLTESNNSVHTISHYYLPITFTEIALSKSSELSGFLAALGLVGIVVLITVLATFVLSKMYVKSLIGFDEKKVRRIKKEQVSSYIQGHVHQGSTFGSLVKLDIINLIREPVYLIQGPVAALIVPIILVVSMYFSAGSSMPPDIKEIIAPYAMPICVGFGLFCSMFTLTSTAISRDMKILPSIKSLPIKLSDYLKAKILHSCIYVVLNIVIALVATNIIVGMTVKDMLIASAILFGINLMFNMVGLWIDTLHPKLKWDSPIQAIKQNVNVMIMMGADFLVIGLCVVGILVLKIPFDKVAIGLGVVSFAAFLALYFSYFPFAEKKVKSLDL